MREIDAETLFIRFRESGDAAALGAIFDRLAPELLLVAAHLAGGHVAEDIVQSTFLDAMRHRFRWDATRPLAPWLLGLLGNHVRDARRQRHRAPDARRLPPHPATGASALDAASADECFAAVAAAVDALPRHYRQVLALRLVHGLELQQIAHSLDVPLGTVKVRVHRGLALLRRALPAGLLAPLAMLATPSPGFAMVRQRVLDEAALLASPGAATTGIAFVIGGLGMKKLVFGVAAAALIAAGAWFACDPIGGTTAPLPPSAAHPVGPVLADVPTVAPSPDSPSTARTTTPEATRTALATTGALRVTATWASDGAPAAGAELVAVTPARDEPATLRTGATGEALFAALPAGSYHVLASGTRGQHAPAVDVRAGETASAQIAIVGDMRLCITVVDAAQTPRAGATVWGSDAARRGEILRELGQTDANGTCTWRGLPVDTVWARLPGRQPSPARDLLAHRESPPPEPIAVHLVLGADACTVQGTVYAPAGEPAANARVAIGVDDSPRWSQPELLLVTDTSGRFHCDEVPAGPRYVVAALPELAPAMQRIAPSPAEPAYVALRLQVGATLSGRVSNADGTPVRNTVVTTTLQRAAPGMQTPWGNMRLTRTDADGRYRITAIAPGETKARVQVDWTLEHVLEHMFTAVDGEATTWNPVRDVPRAIRGVVVDAADLPLVGWQVTTRSASSQRWVPPRVNTDAEGRFELPGLPDEPHGVHVFAPSRSEERSTAANMIPRAIVTDVRPASQPIRIRIDADAAASGWLEGSLTMPADVPAHAVLMLYPHSLRQRGGFAVPTERLDAGQTSFRIGPLPAGKYDLYCDAEGRGRLVQDDLRLAANETLRLPPFAFDAQRQQRIVLRHADGRAATGGVVRLKSNMQPCRETAPGTYESLPVVEGDDEVQVRGPDFAATNHAIRTSGERPIELTVVAATAVVLHLTPPTPRERWVGAMHVTVTDAMGKKIVRDIVQVDGGADFDWPMGLVPGSYTLDLQAIGDGKAKVNVVVGSQPLRVDVTLTK